MTAPWTGRPTGPGPSPTSPWTRCGNWMRRTITRPTAAPIPCGVWGSACPPGGGAPGPPGDALHHRDEDERAPPGRRGGPSGGGLWGHEPGGGLLLPPGGAGPLPVPGPRGGDGLQPSGALHFVLLERLGLSFLYPGPPGDVLQVPERYERLPGGQQRPSSGRPTGGCRSRSGR